ncbi:uncharacterized protein [Battus philenor]|uniref:uncharacterized protein n=1 Tax=Battus philenor TaxID=42288 RepID=UPI0035CFA50B
MIILLIASSVLVSCARASHELQGLYGQRGDNKVTLCLAPGADNDRCDGALWSPNWVLLRGSCVADKAMYPVIVFRKYIVNCATEEPDRVPSDGRRVSARFLHPAYPQTDFALISFVKPYTDLEPHSNESRARTYNLEKWIVDTATQYAPATPFTRYTPDERNMLFSSPVKMFVATAVLPLTFFIVFFVLVTFYTGNSSVPYTILEDKENTLTA